jgi:hypothetical protein
MNSPLLFGPQTSMHQLANNFCLFLPMLPKKKKRWCFKVNNHRPEYTERAIEVGGTREGQSFVLKV